MPTPLPEDPREELHQLVAGLQAHVELLLATGAHGLPPTATSPMVMTAGNEPDSARTTVAGQDSAVLERAPAATAPQAVADHAAQSSLSTSTREASLVTLARDVVACSRCPLHQTRTQTVFARGSPLSGLCFVGEGPGADEDAKGLPFVGAAGQLLDRMIEAMGFGRDEVYVCNIVKCRPPQNRKPDPSEMAACRPFLRQQLELVSPKVIVALGATAVQGLLESNVSITRLRGNWKLYQGQTPLMPTFHPAYLLRNPRAKREVWDDLKAVVQYLGRELPRRT